MSVDDDRVGRRAILRGGVAAILAWTGAASAQSTGALPRFGYVQSMASPVAAGQREALLSGLREYGWIDGQNLIVDVRNNDDQIRELVRLNVNVLLLPNPYRIDIGLALTRTIPIVTIDLESDPVAKGYVKSLARPGGNITGVWTDLPELAGKQLQLLKEALPDLRRVTVLWDERVAGAQLAATEAAARTAGVAVHRAALRQPDEVDGAVRSAVAARSQAVLTLTSPIVLRAEPRLAELAMSHRLATMSGFTTFPAFGGLMAYGPDFLTLWRQVASYVDRILRGAKPGDLPVERPAKFELRINSRTAKTLGLALPPSLLARADALVQ